MDDLDPAEVATADQLDAICRDLLTAATHALQGVMHTYRPERVAGDYLDRLDDLDPDQLRELLSRMTTTAAAQLILRALVAGDVDERLCTCPSCWPHQARR